jgi:hypothetical protein
LITQNFEQATEHYRRNLLQCRMKLKYVPDFINLNLDNRVTCSCNAGIIGGNDVDFFKKYSDEAFKFINTNDLSNMSPAELTNFNILFEQILFYEFSKKENKTVNTLFNEVYDDLGYKFDDFADFTTIPLNKYFHLIGELKKDKVATDVLTRLLLKDYPEYFFRINKLFSSQAQLPQISEKHIFKDERQEISVKNNIMADSQVKNLESIKLNVDCPFRITLNILSHLRPFTKDIIINAETIAALPMDDHIIKEAFIYETTLEAIKGEFKMFSMEELVLRDVNSVNFFNFSNLENDLQLNTILIKDPYIRIIESCYDWSILNFDTTNFVYDNIYRLERANDSSIQIACIPEIAFSLCSTVRLEILDGIIIELLEEAIKLHTLLKEIEQCFNKQELDDYDSFYKLILIRIKFLLQRKCIKIID